ncbi:hypothetical protein cypCar_00044361 [Cyprinus carpio]|nr:hypothetical protein cypCar_00044361 [Cyprinus carpio]
MSTFVTLAEVLESRGAPLEEDEVWALLLGAAETLISISSKDPGNMCCVISPGSVLLSAVGCIAFKSCGRSEDMGSFASPEMSQSNSSTRRQATEKPVRLSDSLNSLLLSMCEDVAHRRVNLLTAAETVSYKHHKPPSPRHRNIRQMAEDVLQAERNPNDSAHLTDRSQMLRERLRGASCQNSFWPLKRNSTRSPADFSRSHSSHQRSRNMAWLSQSPVLDRRRHFNSRSDQLLGSSFSLNERKIKDTGPEFIQMLEEPLVDLELPNSIVSNKGRSRSNQRDLTVMMPNGQNILLKCDVKSRGADVFDMIVAHANLVEHFYFGLAYSDVTYNDPGLVF